METIDTHEETDHNKEAAVCDAPSSCDSRPSYTRVRPTRIIHTLAEEVQGDDEPDSLRSFVQKLPAQRVSAGGRLVSVREAVLHLMGGAARGEGSHDTREARRGSTLVRHVTQTQRRLEQSSAPARRSPDCPTPRRRLRAEGALSPAAYTNRRNSSSVHAASVRRPCNSAGTASVRAADPRVVRVLVRLPAGTRVSMQLVPESTVAELRTELLEAVPSMSSTRFELCVAVPFTILNNHARTLHELGFAHSVALLIHQNAT